MRTTNDPQAIELAQALFAKKEMRRTEGAIATADYQERQQHQLDNLARLRKLRLERETP
jgi:predicted RNA-binding protein Jag